MSCVRPATRWLLGRPHIRSSPRATLKRPRGSSSSSSAAATARPAHNAIERYFPRQGQRFAPGDYINACTGKYYTNGRPDL
jgi:hypothetical protein